MAASRVNESVLHSALDTLGEVIEEIEMEEVQKAKAELDAAEAAVLAASDNYNAATARWAIAKDAHTAAINKHIKDQGWTWGDGSHVDIDELAARFAAAGVHLRCESRKRVKDAASKTPAAKEEK